MLPDMDIADKESFNFWKNLLVAVTFFTITPLVLGISLFSLFSFQKTDKLIPKVKISSQKLQNSGVRVFASLPSTIPSIGGLPTESDARPEILKQYLMYYKSPLAPFAAYVVEVADKYQIDFRLITAIAQQESNLCKIIPPGSYNCWGWGIHSEGTLGFSSFSEGIETVSEGLKTEYLDKGYQTVEEIMSKYTPLSNGSWAYGVNKFLGEME
jgi:hypothetical protein